jgi:MFS family permease
MGIIGAAGNIGFLAGLILSAVSGALMESHTALRVSFGILAVLHVAIGCIIAVGWRLNANPTEFRRVDDHEQSKNTILPTVAFVVRSVVFTSFASMLPLYAARELGLSSGGIGASFFFLAIVAALTQARASAPIQRSLGFTRGVIFGFAVVSVGLLMYSYISSGLMYYVVGITLVALGSSLVNALLLGFLSSEAGDARQGQVLGVAAMISAVSAVVGPFVGGGLLEYVANRMAQLPLIASLVIMCVVLLIWPLRELSRLERSESVTG